MESQEKRRSLLGRLCKGISYTAPALVIAASGAAFQVVAADVPSDQHYQMLAMAVDDTDAGINAQSEPEGEGEGEGEGEEEEKG